jgi:LacI family transcriptional regulator
MLGVQAEGLMYGVARGDDAVLAGIIEEDIPVVLFNRAASDMEVSAVLPDDHGGTRLAVQHLISLGHTRIVHVGGPEDVSSTVNRLEAFEETLRAADLTGSHQFTQRQTEDEGYRVTATLLEERPDTTAVLAANDRLALGAIDAIRDTGRACPGDISVVGFNDMPYTDRFSPPLTTIRISQNELGARTARLLLETIADPRRAPETQLVSAQLVVRGSTAPARADSR